MNDTVKLLLFLFGYVVLMKWLLPWLGVPTCMSGACNAATRRKREVEQASELSGSGAGKPTPER